MVFMCLGDLYIVVSNGDRSVVNTAVRKGGEMRTEVLERRNKS